MSEHMVKYGSFDMEDADDIDSEMSKSFSAEWMKLQVGKNVVRFLPPPLGSKALRMVWEHQLNLPNGDFRNFACPRLMVKKSCMICRKADQLKATGNPADFDRAKDLFPRKRVYANVIDRGDPESGPKVFAFGVKIWEMLKEIRDDEDFGGDFTNPETGFDIVIKRKGSGKEDTKYYCKATRQSPLGNDEWFGQQHSLDRFAKILTEEEIREKLSGDKDGGRDDKDDKDGGGTVVDASFDDDDDTPF